MDIVSVRYIVTDVEAAIRFYTDLLGFRLDPGARVCRPVQGQPAPAAQPSGRRRGGAGGRRHGAPGGWNCFQFRVEDLAATVARMKQAGACLRGGIVVGNGGSQCLVEDPAGNPVELFQPAPRGVRHTAADVGRLDNARPARPRSFTRISPHAGDRLTRMGESAALTSVFRAIDLGQQSQRLRPMA